MGRDAAKKSPKPEEDRHFVTALARGLEVLHSFKSAEERLGNQEIAQRCGLPKSTITRLTYTLTRLGYLHQAPRSGRYRLGLATLGLGGASLSRLDVREVSRPLMQELANRTDCLVSLGTRDGLSILYVEQCRSPSIVTLRLDIGTRMPLATTAIGRAFLAGAPEEIRKGLEKRIKALDPIAWPRLEAGIRKSIDDLAEIGCCCSFGDWRKEINGIGAPLMLGSGLPTLVINAAAPALMLSEEAFVLRVRPELIATVRSIEGQFGSRDRG